MDPVQGIETEPLAIEDYSGGITDFYVNGPLNRYQKAENLVLEKHGQLGKLYSRWGSEVYDTSHDYPDAHRVHFLKLGLHNGLYAGSNQHIYRSGLSSVYPPIPGGSGAWVDVLGPGARVPFLWGWSNLDHIAANIWNGHLILAGPSQRPIYIYNNTTLRTCGLPAAGSGTVVTIGMAGANNYDYICIHRQTYTIDSTIFLNRSSYIDDSGTTSRVSALSSSAPNASSNTVKYTSPLSTTYDHYDTSNIYVEFYRTTNNGTVFYLLGSTVLNYGGDTVFVDNISDAALITQQTLYTTGGVVQNDQAPGANAGIHICAETGIAYFAQPHYGVGRGDASTFQNRVMQSIPGDFSSAPRTFYCNFEDSVMGVSSVQGIPIAITTTRSYRIEGTFDLLGRGAMTPVPLVGPPGGCIDTASLVQTGQAVFWAGLDGFYATDGYSVRRVTDWQQTYATIRNNNYSNSKRISGVYDASAQRIYWTAKLDSISSDNDALIVMDLRWGISEATPCTIWTGGASFRPSAIEVDSAGLNPQGLIFRADHNGYVFRHRANLLADPVVNTLTSPATWTTQPILFDYRSCAMNFGTDFMRKYVPRITTICTNESNLSMQITSVNDDGKVVSTLSPIRFVNGIVWGDPDVYWGDSHIVWGLQGVIDEWRRFPSPALRCSYKQIYLQNAKTAIVNSDVAGTCYTDTANKYAYLTNGAFQWPSLAVGYVIAFAADGYLAEFTIIARDDTKITVQDDQNILPGVTGSKWVIRGIPKGQRVGLQTITLHYAIFGKTQQAYRKSDTGEVGS